MLSITDLKKDTLIEINGAPYRVVEYAQKQMGRGGSIVNTKLKNLIDGNVLQKTFKGNDKIEEADVSTSKVQFLYADTEDLHFMNSNDFSQFALAKSTIEAAELLTEGLECQAQFFNGNPVTVVLPIKLELKVTEAPEIVRGDTQSTVQKDVTLETGAVVKAPIFIKSGDKIVIDSRTMSYVERVK